MKTVILFLFSFSFIALNAQETVPEKGSRRLSLTWKEKRVRDTIIPAGRNEIYLNIGPVFSMFQGSYPGNEANYSLFYKRVLNNPRVALRTGFSFKPQTNIYSYYFNTNDDWYFDETDSTRTVNKFHKGNINKFQLNLGMEYRSKGNKRWSTFAGADIIGGYYSRSYSLTDFHEVLDSTGQWNLQSNGVLMLDYKQSDNFYIGISPKCGLRYAFNSHWMMCVQAAFNAAFYSSDYYERNSMGTGITKVESSYFEFNMNGLLEEFSIAYRF